MKPRTEGLINLDSSYSVRFTLNDAEYISNRYVAVREDRVDLEGVLDIYRGSIIDPVRYPSEITGRASGGVGPETAAFLLMNRSLDIQLHDSDVPNIYVVTLGGEPVGFTTKQAKHGGPQVSAGDLPLLLDVVEVIRRYCGEGPEAIQAAYQVLDLCSSPTPRSAS